jgi:hypothetical protein
MEASLKATQYACTKQAEVRRLLVINEGDRVALVMDDNQRVCLTRTESVVVRTAGMLRSGRSPLTAEELRTVGEQAVAESVTERNGE